MSRRSLWVLAVLVFLGTLISQAPASLVAAYAKPRNMPPLLYGASGTLFDGEAASLNIGGRMYAESLHWTLKPLWLLLGRVALELEGTGTVNANGQLQYGLGGLRLRHFQVDGGVKDVAAAAGFPFVPADGRVSLDITALRVSGGVPQSATAQVDVRGLQWTLARTPTALGSFHADVTTDGDAIIAAITSPDGPLDASGTAKLSPKTREYESDLALKPKAGSDAAVAQLLQGTGQPPDANGAYHLRGNGALPQ